MNVHFSPEEEAELSGLAQARGVTAETLVKNEVLRLLGDASYRAAVQLGIDQADRGEFIEEEEMNARIEEMLRAK